MKNKLFLSFSLIIFANSFVATSISAITFKQGAKITGKTALGAAALATSLASIVSLNTMRPDARSVGIYCLAGIVSLGNSFLGYKAFQSALK